MRICLVRHAQSSWQLAPGDDLDTALTATGREQARQLGRWLLDQRSVAAAEPVVEVAAICASPFQRSLQTAAYAADALRLSVLVRGSLGEANFRVADHLPVARGPLLRPGQFEPSAEYAAFRTQARDALVELVQLAESCAGPVLAVTHGGLIKTLLRHVMGTEWVCFRLCNCGLTVIEWRRGRWHLVHLNLWDHLRPDVRTW